ncbi:hypothetical protein EV360DRAFT_90868, partial [Lentinula raphanica]
SKPVAPSVSKPRLRPPSPDFDAVTPRPSTDLARLKRRPPQAFPVPSSDVEMEGEDEEIFKSPGTPDVLVLRQSIARAAKSKPLLPEDVRKAPTPPAGVKRDHSPGTTKSEPATAEPPKKRRRTQKVAGKSRAGSTAPTLDDPATPADLESLRIQEGEPAYFHGDDTRVTAHANFLTNPNFQVKTPFSQLIRKAVATNKRGSKIPFLRAPKWKVSEEMKNFGAFATIGDTTFSLQGLSRFGYASSRFLWPTNNRTLPSPEALYSTNNCLTCTTRGEVCESSEKHGGPCRQCNGTHRSCPSCLSLDDHRDRFLALHKHVQGYPDGYAASLDYYASALDRITKLQATFAPLFQDATQDLLKGMRQVRDSSFDLNVVLSRWADDNPNLPLDYDTLTWLATLFGWNSACNLADYLANPDDLPRLEEFMREQLPPPPDSADPAPSIPPRSAKSSPQASPVISIPGPPDPQPLSRRRPAAAVPSNFHHSPDTRLAPTP